MKSVNIQLKSIADVKDFVNIVSKFDCDVDLCSDRYVVDAKSILGIFSLDLGKPVKVQFRDSEHPEFLEAIEKFKI